MTINAENKHNCGPQLKKPSAAGRPVRRIHARYGRMHINARLSEEYCRPPINRRGNRNYFSRKRNFARLIAFGICEPYILSAICQKTGPGTARLMEPLVRLEGVTKDYKSLRALDNVSLEIGPGVTGLLGPNGAGKTTLIKVLLGLVRVTKGTGTVMGAQLGKQTRLIRSRVGYMPEDDCYIAKVAGVDSVRFSARLSGFTSIEGLRRAHEILDFCGAEQERYRAVETYSGGMRQKLKFAQAIVHDPPFLILDEPTAGLDPEERQAMLARIRVLATRAGKAILLCTHILPDVQSVCDNVIILARGKVRVIERLDVLSRPAEPAFHLRVLGSADDITRQIERSGYRTLREDDGTITIHGADDRVAEQVWDWARAAGVGVRSLVPARNSLEQIFVDAVREVATVDS